MGRVWRRGALGVNEILLLLRVSFLCVGESELVLPCGHGECSMFLCDGLFLLTSRLVAREMVIYRQCASADKTHIISKSPA